MDKHCGVSWRDRVIVREPSILKFPICRLRPRGLHFVPNATDWHCSCLSRATPITIRLEVSELFP
jgi:hypothetical protein